MRKANALIVTLFFVWGLIAYNLWPLVGPGFYYRAMAGLMMIASLFMLVNTTGHTKRLAFTCLGASTGELIDELWGDPMVLSYCDYIILPISYLVTYLPRINERFKR